MITSSLFLNILVGAGGLALLVKGSGWLIDGAAAIAHRYRIPDAIIGLTLVSIGTSLPELATNIYAAVIGQGDVALGNVAGSNVTNVCLVLGIAVMCLGAIETNRELYDRDAIIMLIVYGAFALCCYTGAAVSRLEGILLSAGAAWYVWYLFRARGDGVPVPEEHDGAPFTPPSLWKPACQVLLGVLMVPLGAKLLVDVIVWGARHFSVPEAAVSATLIAFGTSVPELAVTMVGVAKRKSDISMGNIIGSNIFNVVLVMGATAVIAPAGNIAMGPEVAHWILPYMLATGAALTLFMRSSWALVRWEGASFLLGYIAFLALNIFLVLRK